MSRCKNCLIPDVVPGVILQANGICNFCHQEAEQPIVVAAEEEARQAYEAHLERTLKEWLDRFFNPKRFPAGTLFPRYLAPFHAWPYNQKEIRDFLKSHLRVSYSHSVPGLTA